jgi:hypothetical protein
MPSETKKPAMSSLEQLKATGTFIVADSGDFEVSAVFKDQKRRIGYVVFVINISSGDGGGGLAVLRIRIH